VAASGPLGPVEFHHLLGMGLQEPAQAGAIATGALIAHTRWPGCWLASFSSCW
jgi:hypothetical protein